MLLFFNIFTSFGSQCVFNKIFEHLNFLKYNLSKIKAIFVSFNHLLLKLQEVGLGSFEN